MKTTITNLALFSSFFMMISCSDESSINVEQQKKIMNSTEFINTKNGLPIENSKNGQNNQSFCFTFAYPISVKINDESTLIINDETQLNYLLRTESLEWLINSIEYPFVVNTVVTSESNLDEIAFDGNDNNGNDIGNTIVTSESNLKDILSVDDFSKLIQNCK